LSLLSPAFLFGLAALAIPVLLHLVHRERRQTLPFPSLMFLRRIPHRTMRRQKLRHLWLLALRCLGLALLTLAFAQPLFEARIAAAGDPEGARGVVVLVDRSWSMAREGRWPQAVAAARGELGDLEPGDKAALVVFDEQAEALSEVSDDPGSLAGLLDDVEPGDRATRFAPALKLAGRLLAEAGTPRRELVLISDFPSRAADGVDEVGLPSGTAVRWVDVAGEAAGNRGVTDVALQRVYESGRELVVAAARLVSQGAPGPVQVTLELGGRELQQRVVELPEEGVVSVRFDPMPLPAGEQRGAVRLEPDALPPDDEFRFVLSPGQELRVLLVEEEGERTSHSLFLRRALAIGDRPRFGVRLVRRPGLVAGDLEGVQVVLLNDTAWPEGGAGERLQRFVEAGGGLVAALGARSRPEDWAGAPQGLLPGALARGPVDRSGDFGGTLAFIDYDHPVFSLFRAPRSGDFSSTRFLRYRALSVETEEGVLARFDDGRAALVERDLGAGRALLWTSSLDTLWNDLPLKPVFLPFLHRVLVRAADHSERPAQQRSGEVLELPLLAAGAGWIGESPRGGRLSLEPGERYLELVEAGFYELRSSEDDARALGVAVNVDPAEADRARIDPEELAGSLSRPSLAGDDEAAAGDGAPPRSGRVAWALVLLAGALLMTETALSNRLSGDPA
jgi:hypothetical protein